MKKYISMALLFLVMGNMAQAQDTPARRFCSVESDKASGTMGLRQAGVSIKRTYEIMIDDFIEETTLEGDKLHLYLILAEDMILKAYDSPLYSLPENKEDAIKEAENERFVMCMKRDGLYSDPLADFLYY